MGIKTDYLKDCITGNSITTQDLINLKGSINNIPDNNSIADQLSATIQKLEAQIDIELQQTKKEITDEVNAKIEAIKLEIEEYKKKLKEIYNKVVQFRFKNISSIERNKNNDIVKIVYDDDSYIEVEYNNLPYENEYINYMPTKLNYYDPTGNLIAIESIAYKNESIIQASNQNF